jgi:hypothetical protein
MRGTDFRKDWKLWLQDHWAEILAGSVAMYAMWVAIRYANQPLLEAHGFRQTQTALTSYWIMHEGWQLAYQTPVAGYPWSIPFEFPIYQLVVALIAWVGAFPLDPTGRLVSFVFLMACAWPAMQIARRLDFPSNVAWIFCALLWSSPIYLFWGRTFMIETAAMFFTLAAIPYALDLRASRPRWRSVFLCALFAMLGMLQKVTTAGPVIMVLALLLLTAHLKTDGFSSRNWRAIACVTMAFAIPVIATLLWTRYTDFIKQQNFLGAALTSAALSEWTFGTIQQRWDLKILRLIIWNRALVHNAGGIVGAFLVSGALFFGERRAAKIILANLILFVAPILIFINLHYIHDYYQASCVVFLIGALALATALWVPKATGKGVSAPIVAVVLVICNLYYYSVEYKKKVEWEMKTSTTPTLNIGSVLRRFTPKDSGIVIFGADWSSEIAYYSERKSFTVPPWFKGYDDVWNEPTKFLGDKKLGAVVGCVSTNKPTLKQILERPDVRARPSLFKIDECYLWLPNVASITLPDNNRLLLPMDSTK